MPRPIPPRAAARLMCLALVLISLVPGADVLGRPAHAQNHMDHMNMPMA